MGRLEKRSNLLNREKQKRNKVVHYYDKDAEEMLTTFRDNLNRIKKRFEIVNLLKGQNKLEEANDILRFQIVYAMSSLDFFMHEIYSYGLMKIFRNASPKTYKYNEYKIPLKLLEKSLYDPENIDHYIKETFVDQNKNYTFMSPGRIRELLNIISSEDEFAAAERELKLKKVISEHVRLDHVLEHIYDRRNKIAHQTDINHGEDDKNSINKEEVEYYIDIISHFGEALYKTICLNK